MNSYLPPETLLSVGEALSDADRAQTLLRFPGPCGFSEIAKGQLRQLGPENAPYLYMFKNRYADVQPGVECFGTLAVFSPGQYQTVRVKDEAALQLIGYLAKDFDTIFLGLNLPVTAERFFWMPPEMYASRKDWTHVHDGPSMQKLFGSAYDTRLREMKSSVLAYMEEVGTLERSGANLQMPWYKYALADRQRLLTERKALTRWTKSS